MISVLVSAYAISPTKGSEPGMGWNWMTSIAKYCQVYVITEGEWRDEIENAMRDLPWGENIHMYYNPVSERIRRMCWNQGDWRFYHYYRKWQKKALHIAEEIMATHRIDILHQLNMVGFREPGFLWKIPSVPFVWGPIAGMDLTPLSMMGDEPLKNRLFEGVKYILNYLQIHFSFRVRKAIRRGGCVIVATKATRQVVTGWYGHRNVSFINETGTSGDPALHVAHDFNHKTLELLWVGKFSFRKNLRLALRTLSMLSDVDVHLTVAGSGTEAEEQAYRAYAGSVGVESRVSWLGNIPHDEMHALMSSSDLFFFTSINEATSTVVPEAISCNLPVVCFNLCGFGPLVGGKVGETVEVSTPELSATAFAEKIRYFSCHREELARYSDNCDNYKEALSWDGKARSVLSIYNSLINK